MYEEADIVIIGGGPAGLSAAIYASRAGHKTIVLDKGDSPVYKIDKISNYLGFPEDITGRELIEKAKKQVERFNGEIRREEVLGAKIKENGKYLIETNKNSYLCQGIIIAMGVSYKKAPIKNLDEYQGRGVSYCVQCDGFFFRGAKVIVIGNKNYTAKEALELTDFTDKITIFTNGLKPEIDDELLDKLKAYNIEIREDKIVQINGKDVVESVTLENGDVFECAGIFVALGSTGALDIALKLGLEVETPYIKVDKFQRTNLSRIYAAGDCTGGNRQIAIAVGEGADAAINLMYELKGIPPNSRKPEV
ncbi:MAG: NAD(P)/FAD-dependent oxidoreductase [Candidatus Odinarchaeia archaeon]